MLRYAVAAAILAAIIVVVTERRDTRVLAGNIGVTAYPNGIVVAQVPYRRDGDAGAVTIGIGGHTVIHAMPARAEQYGNDNYFFRPPAALDERVLVIVSYDSVTGVETRLSVVKVAHARVDAELANAADKSAPNAATETVVALAKAHDADDQLPADPLTVVEELKGDMRWTVSDGATPEQYVNGLNLWATKKGLPIRTEKVTGKPSAVLDVISRTLANGGTAQVYLRFKPAYRTGRRAGRMVSIVRVIRSGDDTFIGIRDSASSAGVDVYRVRGDMLVDYAFSDDTAVIGWGFVQNWNK